jgi:hypothetical protein
MIFYHSVLAVFFFSNVSLNNNCLFLAALKERNAYTMRPRFVKTRTMARIKDYGFLL